MQWLELGKEVVKLGAPLLGAVIAGTPPTEIIEELCKALFPAKNDAPQVMNASVDEITNLIKSDPNISTKLQEIQKAQGALLSQQLSAAATNVMQKLCGNTNNQPAN